MQREDFMRLGVLAQWDAPYLSLKSSFEADVVRGLIPMIEQGHLRPGQKPVYWCPLCASALADTEVEYQDKVSTAIDVAFPVVDPSALASVFGVEHLPKAAFPIWTTTPWTLPANEAVALNAHLDYALVDFVQHGALVIALDLVDAVAQRYGENRVLAVIKGEHLLGVRLEHPFMNRQVEVILGDHVQADAGTGNVHTAPAHGEDDYRVGKQYNLPVDNPVMANSCFRDNIPHVASMHVYKANEPIIKALAKSGHLLARSDYQHSYPHCWRHKKPVIFRATPQYFIGMTSSSLRENALKAIETIDWLPSWGETRMRTMLAARPDWCISRQRCWGTPLPLLIHRQTQALHPDMPHILAKIADVIESEGSEAWFDSSVSRWLGDDGEDYEKIHDTLDVWFDSGMTHACVLQKRDGLSVPADLYFEGSDQHRGWFQTSLLTAMAMRNEAPYRQVITHGYVVDAKGKKMSKSVGNVILPSEVVEKYGADVLRLWAGSAYYQDDINVSDEILKRNTDVYRRLRNTARFLLSNLYDFEPEQDAVLQDQMLPLDQWVIDQAHYLQIKIREAFDTYQFHVATHAIHQFCVVTLGNFYLDIIKDRLYTCFPTALPRRSCQTAMWHLLEALVRWLMPILSFTAEELWSYMPGQRDDFVLTQTWYTQLTPLAQTSPLSTADWSMIQTVRDCVNKVLEQKRQSDLIGSGLDARVILYVDDELFPLLSVLKDELRFVLICSQASIEPLALAAEGAIKTDLAGLSVWVHASDHNKCSRCWQRRPEVGHLDDHPALCQRCVSNLIDGEIRSFA